MYALPKIEIGISPSPHLIKSGEERGIFIIYKHRSVKLRGKVFQTGFGACPLEADICQRTGRYFYGKVGLVGSPFHNVH